MFVYLKNFFNLLAKLSFAAWLIAIVSIGTPVKAGFRWKNDRGQIQFSFDKAPKPSNLVSTPISSSQSNLPATEPPFATPSVETGGGKLEEFSLREQPQGAAQANTHNSGSFWRDKLDFKRSHKLQSQGLEAESSEDKKKEREERKKARARLKDIEKENKLLKEQQKLRDNVMTNQVKLYELNKKPTMRQKVFSKFKSGKSKSSSMTWQAL